MRMVLSGGYTIQRDQDEAVVLHGSPRRGMNSHTLAERFREGLTEGGDAEVTHFYTNNLDVRPWQGCLPP